MKSEQILFSAVHLLLALFFVLAGLGSICLGESIQMRNFLYNFLLQDRHIFTLIGCIGAATGILIFIGLYTMNRKTYYRIAMRPHFEVDPSVIKSYVELCLQDLFPQVKHSVDIQLDKHQKMQVFATLPKASLAHPKKTMKEIEKRLGKMLGEKLGYEKEFILSIAFD